MGSASMLSSVARRFEGKVALITGGASGIGKCTANLFARHNAQIVVADIQDEKGRALCEALGPAVASYVHCDVTSESDMESAVDAAVARFGKLDIMFSNAGIIGDWGKGLIESEKPDFERVMATNVTGTFLAIKHAARVMVPARAGSIVITASNASANAGFTPHAYTCSKHAVVGLMRSAAVELGRYGVRVNCVSPHGVATPMAMGALGMQEEEALEAFVERSAILKGVGLKAADIAEAVGFLAGDGARYVSGVNFLVDGGFTVAKSLQ